jgi:signal peptidase I
MANPTEIVKEQSGSREFWRFIIIIIFVILPLRLFVIQPFIVSGDSMYPTFENKDYLIVDALSYKIGSPNRGDVIIFKYPFDTKRYFIKRVIGLPGETVVIKNERVNIKNTDNPNGFELDQSYITFQNDTELTMILKNDEYFVMGDNRPVSSDSRVWGALKQDYIVGRPLLRMFPVPHIGILPGRI